MSKMILVRAVKRGWYGIQHTDPMTGKKRDFSKLYDPEKMKPDQLVFQCREEDFSDSTRTHRTVKVQAKDGTVTEKTVKCRGGWMERVAGAPVIQTAPATQEPLVIPERPPSARKPAKKGEEI